MNSLFYATLSLPGDRIFCLAITARDMMAAMDQVQAWVSGWSAARTEIVPTIDSISGSKPRGLEAQLIHNFVKVPG